MPSIFVDTNLLLGLYDATANPEAIIGDLEKVRSRLVLTDVVLDELLRNRDRILSRNAARIEEGGVSPLQPPFFLQQTRAFSSLKDSADAYNLAVKTLLDEVYQMIEDPNRDPVYSALSRLFQDLPLLEWTEEDVERAHRRKLIGNPPTSPGTDTIGDELNWELLLKHVPDDLILVSRDNTFRYHATFLGKEYLEKTGRWIRITDRLSDALKELGKEPSEALLAFEETWKER